MRYCNNDMTHNHHAQQQQQQQQFTDDYGLYDGVPAADYQHHPNDHHAILSLSHELYEPAAVTTARRHHDMQWSSSSSAVAVDNDNKYIGLQQAANTQPTDDDPSNYYYYYDAGYYGGGPYADCGNWSSSQQYDCSWSVDAQPQYADRTGWWTENDVQPHGQQLILALPPRPATDVVPEVADGFRDDRCRRRRDTDPPPLGIVTDPETVTAVQQIVCSKPLARFITT